MQDSNQTHWIEETLATRIQQLMDENEALRTRLKRQSEQSKTPTPGSHPAEAQASASQPPPPSSNAEIERLQQIIADLEQQLHRFQNRWHYALTQWVLQFCKTWFLRLPMAAALWIFHLFSVLGHRFARQPK